MEDKKVLMLLKLELESRIAARTVVLTQTKMIMLNIASTCRKLAKDAETEPEDQAHKVSRSCLEAASQDVV